MKTTRRGFVATAAAWSAMAAMSRGVWAQGDALEQRLANDPERPQFHLLPAKNWMNDPNGPIFFNGKYHMFFQYNPLAAVWGDMSWNHAVSNDMLHWTHEPVALTPTPGGVDSFGVFSGSAIAVGKRVYAVYTGTQKSDDAHATIRDGANNIQESQCLAWSDDPMLLTWTKDPVPVIAAPPQGMKITGFRDPSIWRSGAWYYMTVGSGVERVGGCVLLYRSPVSGDLKSWEYLHPLTSGAWNGVKTPNPCDDGEMWECPEFFALDGQHVLIYSTLGKVFWQSGALDEKTMTFAAKKTGELDLGAFYAPKTQLDAQGRRILWGWIPEKRSEDAMKAAGWSGMMSLPRVMNLDKDGTLRVRVVPQAHSLRSSALKVEGVSSGIGVTMPAANGELLCLGVRGKSFELRLGTQAELELATVKYVAARHVFVADGKEIALLPEDTPTVHAFVDGSVIEMVLGERIGLTKRFYYEGAAPAISAIAESEAESVMLQAWKIAPISKDRLTTPA
jgi:beta-fructofuranosidase